MPQAEVKIIDLGECSSLLVEGFRFLRLERTRNNRSEPIKIFIFESDPGIADTIEKYKNQNLKVDAYSFYRAFRDMKNRIAEDNKMHNL